MPLSELYSFIKNPVGLEVREWPSTFGTALHLGRFLKSAFQVSGRKSESTSCPRKAFQDDVSPHNLVQGTIEGENRCTVTMTLTLVR
jgi:hypothetical protein